MPYDSPHCPWPAYARSVAETEADALVDESPRGAWSYPRREFELGLARFLEIDVEDLDPSDVEAAYRYAAETWTTLTADGNEVGR